MSASSDNYSSLVDAMHKENLTNWFGSKNFNPTNFWNLFDQSCRSSMRNRNIFEIFEAYHNHTWRSVSRILLELVNIDRIYHWSSQEIITLPRKVMLSLVWKCTVLGVMNQTNTKNNKLNLKTLEVYFRSWILDLFRDTLLFRGTW